MKNFSLIVFYLLISCSVNKTNESMFGAPYSINLYPNSPLIKADSLIISLSYSGGCDHVQHFELKKRFQHFTSELWVVKTTPEGSCDLYTTEERFFLLSENILDSKNIVLITPSFDRITLK